MSKSVESRIVKSDVWEAVRLSEVLGSSKNQVALFKFLLDHKFSTSAAELKTKNIAVNVFDRDDSFSAKKDSIVRVEMFRLRANLETFNQQSETFQIALPKSSYLLLIELPVVVDGIAPPSNVKTEGLEWRNKKKFFGWGLAGITGALVLISTGAFNVEPRGMDCSKRIPNIEIALSEDTSELDEYVHHVISGAASQFTHFNIVQDIKSCASSDMPAYKLEFALLQNETDFQGSLSVMSELSTKIIGVDNFSGVSMGALTDPSFGREDLYFTIAKITNDLLKVNGVVHRDTLNQKWNDPTVFEDYSCLAKMYESFISDTDDDYFDGLKCLEGAYNKGSTSLDNMGGLAASYLEQAQGNRDSSGGEPLAKAKTILDNIGDKWPQSADSTIAKIMYDTVREDYNSQGLIETLLRAEKNYASHPTVLHEVSRYYGFMLGDWDSAVRIMNRAKRLMSDQDNSVYQVDAAYAVLGKGGPAAWTKCLKAYSEHSKVSNLLVHACAVKYKNNVWEKRTADNLIEFNLFGLEERRRFIEEMGFEENLANELLTVHKYNF